jgi:hypothetical protein
MHISVEWNPQRQRRAPLWASRSKEMPTGALQAAVRRVTPASTDTGKRFAFYPECPHRLWAPARLIFSVYWVGCLPCDEADHPPQSGVHVNPLNAELNPICHLLVILGDLTFMGKCIVSLSNKMQRYTVYLYLETALQVSGGTSTHHQE